ncbi:hypothetical protein [Olivibacter ginsenosidimutans]|uniref:hypothetical protein n=1 Tax=Olivibacter ginsenosidimutans TaxID=1176537 RepID=UPI0031E6707F
MQHIDPDLLERYFKGKCSRIQEQQVSAWLKQEAGFSPMDTSCTTQERERIKQLIWERVKPQAQHAQKFSSKGRAIRILTWPLAACLILTLLFVFRHLSTTLQDFSNVKQITFHAPYGKKSVIHLSDGSIAELNAGTILIYPEKFGKKIRRIRWSMEKLFLISLVIRRAPLCWIYSIHRCTC